MISVRNLHKIYMDDEIETPALRGVSLTVKEGEFTAIMGPSGSGKSTLLHILSFLDRPSAGEYLFQGKSIESFSDGDLARLRNEEVGFVFQSFNLLSRSSVYENVEVPLLYNSKIQRSERKERITEAIRSVGLEEKLMSEAGKLSGGQKQRAAIARALVTGPRIIFADEPTGNLDSDSGEQIMQILQNLHSAGRTIILVTHETYTARFADRLISMKDGHIELDGPISKKDGEALHVKK